MAKTIYLHHLFFKYFIYKLALLYVQFIVVIMPRVLLHGSQSVAIKCQNYLGVYLIYVLSCILKGEYSQKYTVVPTLEDCPFCKAEVVF